MLNVSYNVIDTRSTHYMACKLYTISNTKTIKSQSAGYMTFILHLAPADEAGVGNMCAKSTAGCRAGCLNKAGHGGMFTPGAITNPVQTARVRRTKLFASDRQAFLTLLVMDTIEACRIATKKQLIPIFRLNGTSDIPWEKITVDGYSIFDFFPDIQFYDYTKILGRKVTHIPNYHLTFSQADGNEADVDAAIKQGYNIATVFYKSLPLEYKGLTVVNGDESDMRFLDPTGVIVGLTAKGPAKKDYTGFVIRLTNVV